MPGSMRVVSGCVKYVCALAKLTMFSFRYVAFTPGFPSTVKKPSGTGAASLLRNPVPAMKVIVSPANSFFSPSRIETVCDGIPL